MQLRVADGRAVLVGDDGPDDGTGGGVSADPRRLALDTDLAEALHEWAQVAAAVQRAGRQVDAVAGSLVSRRGRQLAARLAAVMGVPIGYQDPLTGEISQVTAPVPEPPEPDPPEPAEPTPWATGLTVSGFAALLVCIAVVSLSVALGADSRLLALAANLVIGLGLAPSVWLARSVPVWRWVAFGVVIGLGVAWVALLFTLA